MKIEDCSGVYLIVCRNTGKKYVGASFNVKKRVAVHHRRMECDSFLLAKTPRSKLPLEEKKWINKLQPELNKRPAQTGAAGQRRSVETKKRMSAWQLGLKRGPHGRGERISAALKGVAKSSSHKRNAALARKKVGNKPWGVAQRAANIWTTERRAKLSASKKGKPWSAKRRAAQRRSAV